LSGGHGVDDIFFFFANERLGVLASFFLGADGWLNFFAGPPDKHFHAPNNFYDVQFAFFHNVGCLLYTT
ncbi:L-sorbose 1-phosphate reductase, partial [Escherichia coli]|nr:L-sorbose 1-phosphate reductase [Escherichia coli]